MGKYIESRFICSVYSIYSSFFLGSARMLVFHHLKEWFLYSFTYSVFTCEGIQPINASVLSRSYVSYVLDRGSGGRSQEIEQYLHCISFHGECNKFMQ
jgi:hypothetical protein